MAAKRIKVACNVPLPNGGGMGYKVINTHNTINFIPGEVLESSVVQKLCDSPEWDVTVIPPITA